MAMGLTKSLTEMRTRNLPGGKGWLARKADSLTAIYEPIVWRKCGSLDVSQPYGSPRPVTGISLTFYWNNQYKLYTMCYKKNGEENKSRQFYEVLLTAASRFSRGQCA
jgi:hypothetical protein